MSEPRSRVPIDLPSDDGDSTRLSLLWYAYNEVGGDNRPYDCSPITERVDQLVQVFNLQSVVKCVPKSMGPMEERQDAKDQQIHAPGWAAGQCQKRIVARRIQ